MTSFNNERESPKHSMDPPLPHTRQKKAYNSRKTTTKQRDQLAQPKNGPNTGFDVETDTYWATMAIRTNQLQALSGC